MNWKPIVLTPSFFAHISCENLIYWKKNCKNIISFYSLFKDTQKFWLQKFTILSLKSFCMNTISKQIATRTQSYRWSESARTNQHFYCRQLPDLHGSQLAHQNPKLKITTVFFLYYLSFLRVLYFDGIYDLRKNIKYYISKIKEFCKNEIRNEPVLCHKTPEKSIFIKFSIVSRCVKMRHEWLKQIHLYKLL